MNISEIAGRLEKIPLVLLYLSGGFVLASISSKYALDLSLKIFVLGVVSAFTRQIYKDIGSFLKPSKKEEGKKEKGPKKFLRKEKRFWWAIHYVFQLGILGVLTWVILCYRV